MTDTEPYWSEELITAYCNQHSWERTGVYMNEKELSFFEAAIQDAEAQAAQFPELAVSPTKDVKRKINERALDKGLPPLPNGALYYFIGTGEFVKKWSSE